MNNYYIILKCFIKSILLSFGGGYTFISMVKDKLVTECELIDLKEYNNFLNWAQIIPGPVSFNFSVIFSYHISGIGLALISMIVILIPPITIVLLLSHFLLSSKIFIIFLQGVLICVPILILNIVIGIAKDFSKISLQYLYAIASLIIIIISSGELIVHLIIFFIVISILHYLITSKRNKTDDIT